MPWVRANHKETLRFRSRRLARCLGPVLETLAAVAKAVGPAPRRRGRKDRDRAVGSKVGSAQPAGGGSPRPDRRHAAERRTVLGAETAEALAHVPVLKLRARREVSYSNAAMA